MSAGGWPDPARPGVPVQPEMDGWHWLAPPWGGEVLRYWYAGPDEWSDGFASAHGPEGWRYLGVCHTPAEVAALVEFEREACAAEVDCGCAARPDVLERLGAEGHKRASYLCPHGDACHALQAAALRARGDA